MRIYKDGKLVEISCDRCDARLKPGPHVKDSGWTKYVTVHTHGIDQDVFEGKWRMGI